MKLLLLLTSTTWIERDVKYFPETDLEKPNAHIFGLDMAWFTNISLRSCQWKIQVSDAHINNLYNLKSMSYKSHMFLHFYFSCNTSIVYIYINFQRSLVYLK